MIDARDLMASLRQDGWITLNYVSPDHRFAGVSRALVATLVTQGCDMHLQQLKLESTATAIAFYQSAGFKEAESATTKHGRKAYPMTAAVAWA